jgi:prepilin-type processing-associated H-X9-DG protein
MPNTPGQWGCRSTPAEWEALRVTIAWCDGHANSKRRSQLDDKDGNSIKDNGYWNGLADSTQL